MAAGWPRPLLLLTLARGAKQPENAENRVACRGAGDRHGGAFEETARREAETQIHHAPAMEIGGGHHAAQNGHHDGLSWRGHGKIFRPVANEAFQAVPFIASGRARENPGGGPLATGGATLAASIRERSK